MMIRSIYVLNIFIREKDVKGNTLMSIPKHIFPKINKSVKLKTIAKCASVDVKTLQKYNPELKQGTIPPLKKGEDYILRMPRNISSSFDSLFAIVDVPKLDQVIFIDHKVKRGESLWLIARKYNVRISDIVAINKLSDKSYIRPNQKLKIPTIGIGASKDCDGQVLVIDDILGKSNSEKKPKFVKTYANLESIINNSVKKYCLDVVKKKFPNKKNVYS